MESLIKVENLTYSYAPEEGGEAALKGVDLEIAKGSFTAVIGQNGSGKSTLAKCFNGLLLPQEGRVLVEGMDTAQEETIWDIRQRVGMVFQNPDNQLVSTIVEDDVAFGPENLGTEPEVIRQRVEEALKGVRMGEYRRHSANRLSGGQKQRIAIAGVIAMRPECIVFDESTAMLDPRGRREIMDIITGLHREGMTIIMITHFMEEAAKAERIVVMHQGKVALDGSPVEIFAQQERLSSLGLEGSLGARMAARLRAKGVEVGEDVIDEKGLVEDLCP